MNSGVACSAAAANGEHGMAALVALLVNAFCPIERLKASVTLVYWNCASVLSK